MNFKTDDKPFPIMELPAEIRLDIYRACLTRDRKLLLSKPDRSSQEASAEVASVSDGVSIGSGGESLSQGSEWDLIGPGAANRPWDPAPHRTRGTRSSSRVRDATARRLAAAAVAAVATRAVVVELPEPVDRHQESVNNDIEHDDRLVINILRTSKQIYREARDVLYSENRFELNIDTAVASLAALHQRNRRHIKHIELEIPTYTHILEGFSEIVRLSLRYCTGLQTFVMRTLFTLPGFDGGPVRGSTTVYANGFDILRWLPQTCRVVLEGNHNEEIEAVVQKHMNFASTQSKVSQIVLPRLCSMPGLLTFAGCICQAAADLD